MCVPNRSHFAPSRRSGQHFRGSDNGSAAHTDLFPTRLGSGTHSWHCPIRTHSSSSPPFAPCRLDRPEPLAWTVHWTSTTSPVDTHHCCRSPRFARRGQFVSDC